MAYQHWIVCRDRIVGPCLTSSLASLNSKMERLTKAEPQKAWSEIPVVGYAGTQAGSRSDVSYWASSIL